MAHAEVAMSERLRAEHFDDGDPEDEPAPWFEVLLAEFRTCRVHLQTAGEKQNLLAVASIRPDQWLEYSAELDDENVIVNRVPAGRVRLVEWLPEPDGDEEDEEDGLPGGQPSRVQVELDGALLDLVGTAWERKDGWLDFQPQTVWRAGGDGDPRPEVVWVSFPAHAVHRVQYLRSMPGEAYAGKVTG